MTQKRAKGNIYWDCYHGIRSASDKDKQTAAFSDVEKMFYEIHYSHFVENQNARNAKIRHTERNRTIEDLLAGKKTCPEETIYQFGTLDEHASVEDLVLVVTEFMSEFHERFGTHVHLLDWALHLDESTPHIHERHVFDCENKYGEIAPQQEKALEALGFELPDPDKPLSRRNNRKITFDAACRKMLFEIAKRHGLESGGRSGIRQPQISGKAGFHPCQTEGAACRPAEQAGRIDPQGQRTWKR